MRKPTLNKFCYVVIALIFVGCKPYIDLNKKYFSNNDNKLNYSKVLLFNESLEILFEGKLKFNNEQNRINGTIFFYNENEFQIKMYSKTIGIEIGRIDFYNDSITWINKLSNNYFIGLIKDFRPINIGDMGTSNISRLLLGRNFDDSNIMWVNENSEMFTYNNDIIRGKVEIENFGFNKRNTLWLRGMSGEFNYNNYNKKYLLPHFIEGFLNIDIKKYDFEIRYVKIAEVTKEMKRFTAPKNYNELKFY